MSTLGKRFDRYAEAISMISAGVADLDPSEAAHVLQAALAMVEAESSAHDSAPPQDGTVAGPVATRVLHYVQQHGTATTPAVAAALDITEASASFWLRTLTNAKKITRAKRGTYEAKK